MGPADLGDVPTWLATGGAFLAAWYAAKAFGREVARDDRAERLLEQSQAARVAIWDAPIFDPGAQNPHGYEYIPAFRLRNASDLPIYDVLVYSYWATFEDPDLHRPSGLWDVGLLPPLDEAKRFVAPEDRDGVIHHYAVEFRDAAGRYWHRDIHGRLNPDRYPDRDLPFERRLWDEE